MFDTILSSINCLLGTASECDLQEAGKATTPVQVVVLTAAVGSMTLIVAVWKDAVKSVIKGSFGNLLAATVLMIAAISVPSVSLVALSAVVFLVALLFWRVINSNSLRFPGTRGIALRKLVLPAATLVYATGAVAILTHNSMQSSPPPAPEKLIAFFTPSKFRETRLDVVALSDQLQLLFDIDQGPKTLMSGSMSDQDIEFHPEFTFERHRDFRQSFAEGTTRKLDHWLSKDKDLRHLSEKVDIALEETAMIENTRSESKKLVVHAYLRPRGPENKFHRVVTGDGIVAEGKFTERDQVLLVLTVRLADKLLNTLNLPQLDPETHAAIWSEFSFVMKDRIATILDFNSLDLSLEALELGRAAQTAAADCHSAECALQIADLLEVLVSTQEDEDSSLWRTALTSVLAAYRK